jgi:hypothetical protein
MKKAMEQHQEDVKKAIKIHKLNERLAVQNLELKERIDQLQHEFDTNQGLFILIS